MSLMRRKIAGDVPKEVYVVSWGNTHKVYTRLGSARGVVTQEKNYHERYRQRLLRTNPTWDANVGWNEPKIYKAVITEWVEVD